MALVDSGYYEAQRRGIDEQFATQSAANTYARSLAQQRGSRDINAFQQGFKREIPSFTAGFGQRGLGGGGVRSGVMQQTMRNYVGDYNTQLNNMRNDLTESLRQFDLTNAQLGAQRSSALADLELQKAREIAFAAQNIEALRQVLGGL